MLDVVSSPIIARNSEDLVTYWNKGARQLYGYTAAEALGRNKFELLKTRFPEPLKDIELQLERDGRWTGELLHTSKVGRVISVLAHWALEHGPEGRIKAVLENTEDLTERKRAEEEIRASERRYRLLFDRNPDGVFSVDAEGRFQMLNPACESISGYSKEELIGRHFSDLCAPDQLLSTLENFARVLNSPGYAELETALIRKDGRRVELWIAGEPVVKEGIPVTVYCTVKDITERKHFRAELERLVKE